MNTAPPLTQATIPSPADLRHEGRAYLITLLHFRILCGDTIDAEYWRDAWGQAADYQTVVDARKVLAR